MLEKDPERRFDLRQIKHHSWLRKKHPQICPAVEIPVRPDGDELRSMTVLPYLDVLHYPNTSPEEDDSINSQESEGIVLPTVTPDPDDERWKCEDQSLPENNNDHKRKKRLPRIKLFGCIGMKDRCVQS